MQLTQYTDYSLRVMAYLAQLGSQCTIAEITEYFGVSRNHLVKVVHNLGKHGFIVGMRGKGGGIRLARPPAEISLGAIVRVTEPNFALVECFDARRNCCIVSQQCGLKHPLSAAQRAFMAVLDGSTLADAMQDSSWQPMTAPPSRKRA